MCSARAGGHITKYKDDWLTCAYTHAGFRILHADLEPKNITRLLGVRPTEARARGDVYLSPKWKRRRKAVTGGWWHLSGSRVKSFDLRRHLDWVLDRIEGKQSVIRRLKQEGFHVDMFCRWDSRYGHGGPTISPQQIKKLAKLRLDLWFDVYFNDDQDRSEKKSRTTGRRRRE